MLTLKGRYVLWIWIKLYVIVTVLLSLDVSCTIKVKSKVLPTFLASTVKTFSSETLISISSKYALEGLTVT